MKKISWVKIGKRIKEKEKKARKKHTLERYANKLYQIKRESSESLVKNYRLKYMVHKENIFLKKEKNCKPKKEKGCL
jgi:hypothetical protein